MKILPFLIILVVFIGAHVYVFFRLWQMMPPVLIGRILLVTGGVLACLSLFAFFALRNALPYTAASVLYMFSTSWIFIFLYLLMTTLVLDVIRITHLFSLQKYMYGNWWAFCGIWVFVGLIMCAGYVRYLHKDRVELELRSYRAGEAGRWIRIVAVSDLHLGYGIGPVELQGWVRKINAEKPDVILIAGDVIDNSVVPLYTRNMAEVMRQLDARYGVYACLGNHEHISHESASEKWLAEAGVQVLRDSATLVDSLFYVVGREDRTNPRRSSVAGLVNGLDPAFPVILLDHQPYHLEEATAAGVDLQISGHTHRGQVWPINWITDRIYEVSHGYLKKEHTDFYVSSGIGIWGGKFRIGSRSEYVVIRLLVPDPQSVDKE
ncbi:MAG: metallophosphoesterase [Bacteroides sp.]|nr:metallophosphoesterase [Bacteroides sp.]